jgi:hypothetical protein
MGIFKLCLTKNCDNFFFVKNKVGVFWCRKLIYRNVTNIFKKVRNVLWHDKLVSFSHIGFFLPSEFSFFFCSAFVFSLFFVFLLTRCTTHKHSLYEAFYLSAIFNICVSSYTSTLCFTCLCVFNILSWMS